jgi:hypothetical protein
MADDDRRQRDDAKSLELPSLRSALGLRRNKRRRERADSAPDGPAGPAEAESSPVEPRDPVQPIPPVDPSPPIEPPEPAPPAPRPQPAEWRQQVAVLPAAGEEENGEHEEDAEPPVRRRRAHVHLPGAVVAMVTGALVGLALVGLTTAGLGLCSVVRGTSSCGTPGYLVLLAITVGLVFLGALMLRLLGVPTNASTSFLGLSLVIVVILLALLPVIDAWWMVIAVPVVSMLCYLAAWRLTTTYVEPGDRPR